MVCCFLRFKKLKELSTAIFDLLINIWVALWFKSTWTILEIKGCALAKYQRSRQGLGQQVTDVKQPGSRITWHGGINKFWGARKLYILEFESVEQKKKVFNAKFDEIWGWDRREKKVFITKNTRSSTKFARHRKKRANFHKLWGEDKKKRFSSQKLREVPQILVFIPKKRGNFHKIWDEDQK